MRRMDQETFTWREVSKAPSAKPKTSKPQPLRGFSGRAAAARLQKEAAKK